MLSHQLIVVFGWRNGVGECWFVNTCDIKRERECSNIILAQRHTNEQQIIKKQWVFRSRWAPNNGVELPKELAWFRWRQRTVVRRPCCRQGQRPAKMKVRGCSNEILDEFGAKLKDESLSYTTKHRWISWMETFYAVWASVWLTNWSMTLACNSAHACALWHKVWPNNWSVTHENSTVHS